ncbi:MAG: ABC transporter ATP-binding protein [Bacillota bacterium]|nr:ABC transporter ATP-binding protein [Bacillota bacterium]
MTLTAKELALGYEDRLVVQGLNLEIRRGEIVSFIGPNGSGKSTILKALARTLRARGGAVYLDGRDIQTLPPRQLARRLAFLPQGPQAPADLTVRELVWHGRFPHLRWWESASRADVEAVETALRQTRLEELADRPLTALSGGERQRAWIALALAQSPSILLLDEPTTYLDICHQLEIMELVSRLNAELGLTVAMVLHDINQAARYSHRLVVLHQGRVVAEGPPAGILTEELLRNVFGVESRIQYDSEGKPLCLPTGLARFTKV